MVLAAVVSLFLAACGGHAGPAQTGNAGSSAEAGFLQVGPADATFVHWTRSHSAIVGSFVLSANGSFPGSAYPFTGSISGNRVVLRFGKTFPTPEIMTGTLSSARLRLNYSDDIGLGGTFTAATLADFNRTEAALRKKAVTPSPAPTLTLTEAAVVANVRVLQMAIQAYAVNHDDTFPRAISPAVLKDWPTNPYTNGPVRLGNRPGDVSYRRYGAGYRLAGYGSGGRVLIVVP